MLTKEQIEAIEIGGRDDEWEMSGDLSMDDARELLRLALLGLESEERRTRFEAAAEADTHVELSVLADSFGTFPDLGPGPDLDLGTEPHEAPCQDERDERAERIGRAVITWVGDDTPAQLRTYASHLEADQWPVGADLIRAIADALKEDGNAAG